MITPCRLRLRPRNIQRKKLTARATASSVTLPLAPSDRTLRVWHVPSGKLLHRLVGHEGLIEQAHFSPDSQQIISARWDRTVRIWDSATGSLSNTFFHSDAVTSAHSSPDGQRLAITSSDGTAQVLDVQTGTVRGSWQVIGVPY